MSQQWRISSAAATWLKEDVPWFHSWWWGLRFGSNSRSRKAWRHGWTLSITVTAQHLRTTKRKNVHGDAYLRWSSIKQLASSMAVGLAMFLSAMLFPVFLVAWEDQGNGLQHITHTHMVMYFKTLRRVLDHKLPNTHRFKYSIITAIISPGNEAGTSHQTCTHVAHHVPIQIGHHHHIELLGLGHQLKTQAYKIGMWNI